MQRLEFPAATSAWANWLDPRLDVPAGGGYPGSGTLDFVRIVRTGGTRQTKVTERSQMTFECYGSDADIAERLASKVSSLVFMAEGRRISDDPKAICKKVVNVSGISLQRDPDRPEQKRYVFTLLTALKGAIVSEGTNP